MLKTIITLGPMSLKKAVRMAHTLTAKGAIVSRRHDGLGWTLQIEWPTGEPQQCAS